MNILRVVCSAALFVLAGCSGQDAAAPSQAAAGSVQLLRQSGKAAVLAPPQTESFAGDRASYAVVSVNGKTMVTHVASNLSTYVASATSRLRFADGTLVIDIEGIGGSVYRIYQAAFDRKPDSTGYAFWLNASNLGYSLTDIAAEFVKSQEFRDLYGATPTNAELLNRYYQNVLHRAPDASGYAFWIGVLDSGQASPTVVLGHFSDSAENKAQVLADIQNGIWVPDSGAVTASLRGGGSSVAVGQAVAVDIAGASLTSVSATLGGATLSGSVQLGAYIFIVPELAAGSQELALKVGAQTVKLPLTVLATTLPSAPHVYLESALSAQDAELTRLLVGASAEQAALLQAVRAELLLQKAAIAGLSDADARQAALLIAANYVPANAAQALGLRGRQGGYDPAACEGAQKLYKGRLPTAIGGAILGGLLATTPNPVTRVSGVLLAVGSVVAAVAPMQDILRFCLNTVSVDLSMLGAGGVLAYTHAKLQAHTIIENWEMPGDALALKAQSFELAALLRALCTAAPFVAETMDPLIKLFGSFATEGKTGGSAGDYKLAHVVGTSVIGTASGAGAVFTLTFGFTGTPPAQAQKFEFALGRAIGNEVVGTYSASLSPLEPPVIDAIFKHTSTVVSQNIPPKHVLTVSCGSEPCEAHLFCGFETETGQVETGELRYTLDPLRKTARIEFEGEVMTGTYDSTTGAIAVSVDFAEELVMTSPQSVNFYSGGGVRLQAVFDPATRSITGTSVDTSYTRWTLDGFVATCTQNSSFVATERP